MSQRRLLLAVEQQAYGRRVQVFQADLQQGLVEVLDHAGELAGLHRDSWGIERTGAAQLAVLPHDEPEDAVVFRFVTQLNAELIQYNRLKAKDAWLRLRVAMHHGPASQAANGFAGPGPVVVRELCGSPPLQSALEQTGAHLAVLLSKIVYDHTVAAGLVPLDPRKPRRVMVGDEEAWLWIPGGDAHALKLEDSEPEPERDADTATEEPGRGGVHNFNRAIIFGPAAVGNIYFSPKDQT
jgi:hypothetical protein